MADPSHSSFLPDTLTTGSSISPTPSSNGPSEGILPPSTKLRGESNAEKTTSTTHSSLTIASQPPSSIPPSSSASSLLMSQQQPDGLRHRPQSTSSNDLVVPQETSTSNTRPAPSSTVPPESKPSTPTVVLDGSKIILRLARNNTFVIDHPCKILMATPHIRLERPVAWQTNGTCTEQESTIVIDCGLLGHRFVPIPLMHYGTLYTRDGTIHVTVGTSIRRLKVHSRNLPYRTCNKFHCFSILETSDTASSTDTCATSANPRNSKHLDDGYLDSEQAVKLMKQLAYDGRSDVVYIRADDSIVRYRLGHDEKIELHSGRLVAWTVGIRFEQSAYFCCRFVTAVHGEGTVWIQSARPSYVTPLAP